MRWIFTIYRYLSGIAVGLAAGFVLANNLQLLGRRKAMTIGFMGLSGEYIGRKLGEFRAKDILNNELPKDSKWRNPFRGSGGVSPTATDIDSNKQQPFPSTEPPLDIFPTIPQKKPQRFNKYGDPIDD